MSKSTSLCNEDVVSMENSEHNSHPINPITIVRDSSYHYSDSDGEYEEAAGWEDNRSALRTQPQLDSEIILRKGGTSSNKLIVDLDLPEPVAVDDLEEEIETAFCFPRFDGAKEQAEQLVKRVWDAGWRVTHFYSLPEWLQDNDFIHSGHRPPLPTFSACFRSIFRIHSETGNIWSHMLGCFAFIGVAIYFLTRPQVEIQWEDKLVFSAFFAGAIACLGLSFAFHTVNCHSERMGKLFSKLDYCGITMLIVGSFIPWLFYGFYCRFYSKVVYSVLIIVLGVGALVVSLWDKFGEPKFRPLRAGTFIALGLSGVVPCIHYLITDGFWSAIYEASLAWIVLMAAMYISGALFYAWRIPERFFPGRCDIWFQSHQIFHLFVVIAAFIHYHGITEMAMYRLSSDSCTEQLLRQMLPVGIS